MFVGGEAAARSLDALTLEGDGEHQRDRDQQPKPYRRAPGSGVINATGTTARPGVTISGTGTVLLGELIARDVKAALSCDRSITLTATQSLNASVSGSGTILVWRRTPRTSPRRSTATA